MHERLVAAGVLPPRDRWRPLKVALAAALLVGLGGVGTSLLVDGRAPAAAASRFTARGAALPAARVYARAWVVHAGVLSEAREGTLSLGPGDGFKLQIDNEHRRPVECELAVRSPAGTVDWLTSPERVSPAPYSDRDRDLERDYAPVLGRRSGRLFLVCAQGDGSIPSLAGSCLADGRCPSDLDTVRWDLAPTEVP